MRKAMLTCCKLYISESQNALALESIEQAAKRYPEAVIINKFKDEDYNRVGYTLVSNSSTNLSIDALPLRNAVFSMVKSAFEGIDLNLHSGTHPRLGVVDHICFHPLAQASLDEVAVLAKSAAADIGSKFQVPTFLYGAAHGEGRTLDYIRRELAYFKPNAAGNQWSGALNSEFLPLKPDEGPSLLTQSKGVVAIGATKWVDNYNVPVCSTDVEVVKRIARKVSGRGGGLKSVQAMGLMHGNDSAEVACNLLDPGRVGADQVQVEVERLASEEGVTVEKGYFTDFSQEKVTELYLKSIEAD
ncbi:formiminotransferase cyclodeaminase-like protein isoform X1 [Typha latifolia]|uniref:formiminotransferase cyclodeaminase-like protein isoform X1 n=1 Tax=Typha latifolia TaxID=4733 RepID=UPI003C2FA838